LFQVKREDQQEADRVLENYVRKKVKDILYQARVDAVKVYYKDVLKQNLDDKLARPIELTYEQYLNGRVKWCKRLHGLLFVVIGAQKSSSQNERGGRNLGYLLMILLKIVVDLDHLGRQDNFWLAHFFSLYKLHT